VAALTALLEPLYGARDREAGVEAMLAICDRDVELTPGGLWLDDASVCRGREEVAEFFGRLADAFEDVHFEPERFEERGESVAVLVRLEVRGRHSGISDSRTLGHLWRFRDGKAIEIRAFNDPDDAFAAL
jgi:ketosteroid isomerase-like protein